MTSTQFAKPRGKSRKLEAFLLTRKASERLAVQPTRLASPSVEEGDRTYVNLAFQHRTVGFHEEAPQALISPIARRVVEVVVKVA